MTRMTVNGEAVHYRLHPETPLLWALREASNLTGAKHGCDSGDCGACMVIVDGQSVPSCRVNIASLEGAEITTIEGLAPGRSHPVQQAWAAEQVSQCGFCEPGFIVAIAALLDASSSPSKDQVEAIGNICRCGAYPRMLRALQRAAAASAQAPAGPAVRSGGATGSATANLAEGSFDPAHREQGTE